jgi:glycerol-3-phosphate acyltransferase PlsY
MIRAMMEQPLIWFVAFPLAGYLVGSIPFGVLIARARGVDLRKVGSGNVGATNVVRSVGRGWGYLCFLLDLLKGFVPALTVGLLLGTCGSTPSPTQQGAWLAVGAACVAGHVFPVWLKFRGG